MTGLHDTPFEAAGAEAPQGAFGARMMAWLRRFFSAGAHLVFGVLLVMAAAIVAVSTALVGLVLAAAALVARLVRPAGLRPQPVPVAARSQPVILTARRTSRGWRVE